MNRRKVLLNLARQLKDITGMDPNVSMTSAKTMPLDALEEELRGFGSWYESHAEHTAQRVSRAVYAALDDEEATA